MILLSESPGEYIGFCRQQVQDQLSLIGDFKDVLVLHRDKCGCRELVSPDTCRICEELLDRIIEEQRNLDIFNNRYNKAVRGMYE